MNDRNLNPFAMMAAMAEEQQKSYQRQYKDKRIFAQRGGPPVNFVILQSMPFIRNEHKLVFGQQSYNNFYSCPGNAVCPICYAGFVPQPVGFFTVFDLTKWTKDGKTHNITKKLYAFNKSESAVLQGLLPQYGGSFKGAVLQLTKGERYNVVGPYLHNGSIMKMSDEQVLSYAARDGYKPDFVSPYNYEEMLAVDPVPMLEMAAQKALAAKNAQKGANQGNPGQGYGGFGSFSIGAIGGQPAYAGQPAYGQQPQQGRSAPTSFEDPFGAPPSQQQAARSNDFPTDPFGSPAAPLPPPANAQPVYGNAEDPMADIPF